MTANLKWLGHGSWQIQTDDHSILLDPFLDENPSATCKAADVQADFILVSHGHFDHVADVAAIANRTGATVVAIYEIADWFAKNHGVGNTIGMNIGGKVELPFGVVEMTLAFHSSQLPDGSYGGAPAGFVVTIGEKKLYFACDTALFGDMRLIGEKGVDIAILPIGDHFTMGPDDSVIATKFLQPQFVLPAHYNTWPPIEQNAADWADKISANTESKPIVLASGESFEFQ